MFTYSQGSPLRRENERIKSKDILGWGAGRGEWLKKKRRHIDVLPKIETMDDILNVGAHKKYSRIRRARNLCE